MSSRQGGKAKPLKAPKKKLVEGDEDDAAFKAKQKADAAAKKAMAEKAKKGGPLIGGGIKKSENAWKSSDYDLSAVMNRPWS
ncbi:hypothetical protein KGF56_000204 [Candida oxycetoniae]|uniref:Translation machinery associated TMA7 n=1 Tax=Candida oxycetoniae TaxID=497107 RepID=A0AAI9T1I6_9ASCO|nr:uncharacterized protein KGF56_000204 [Candida oxycetoniae]KAI3406912.2 hypothetical protein KGF56_000204 [Candida oxycetoniae]